ncbi:metallophosphoesterase family protein [Roseimarinus sediminis]|uniref:metallophosphoesterase family protein n=1 Tax=Roseimarinus sediminis TaxID=1610899 RepID=UPI003D1B4BD8
MKQIVKYLFFFYTLLLFAACNKHKEKVEYAFFTAGHVYGNPNDYQYGFHPPLDSAISYLNNYPQMALGIFTGDVVPQPTQAYWDSLTLDLNRIKVPRYITPGNHDRGPIFKNRFGNGYDSFYHHNELFILLNPDNWNIEGEQLRFLKQTLSENKDSSNLIFIFMHELIWWSPENRYSDVIINWAPHYPGSTNYYDDIEPLLKSLPNQVVLFAGDVGCAADRTPCMYDRSDNITLIASGMGSGDRDNLVITEVMEDGSCRFRLIHLNGNERNGMGQLEDYQVPLNKNGS